MIKNKAVQLLAAMALSAIGVGAAQAATVSAFQLGPGTTALNLSAAPLSVTSRLVVNAFGAALDVDTSNGNFASHADVTCQDGNNSGQTRLGTAAANDGDITLLCDFLVPVTRIDGSLSTR
jgi:hypothetical protein